MAKNTKLSKAKSKKNDEFYTQYADIENEINAYVEYDENVFRGKTILLPCDDPEWSNFTLYFAQNFQRFGLKKLISTSYAQESKSFQGDYIPSEFEQKSPLFNWAKTRVKGKIFILEKDVTGDGVINHEDIEWRYLDGDGDYSSEEVRNLRNEADFIITNPPFSQFRQFLSWVIEANKKFIMIANKNCITYKECFPLFMKNKMWSGCTDWSGGMWFETMDLGNVDKVEDGKHMKNVSSIWITNVEHGRRHDMLRLMSMEENIRYSKHREIRGTEYKMYDNYNALEVPFTDSIPSDYQGVMGVPISFLNHYCPEQFEILGATESEGKGFSNGLWKKGSKIAQPLVEDKKIYKRIFIQHKSI